MWSIAPAHRLDPSRGIGVAAAFVRIAMALSADIRAGVLRPGDRLPSTRLLAKQLGQPNTVVAAFDELIAQGWATAQGAAGMFVVAQLPDV